ncbi:SUKH-4 family immunity protein [Amycolatopsis sp. NBC_01488]|uniref:SUKH-4 family immunity protein n=1 Tax=Amycolatopsis sp. NBC_01488 TaxID=2903563 RepID=UPI002E29D718|nr:SUKH-4 family immunity protein [Amycolatopsis sp. NBC_01488]
MLTDQQIDEALRAVPRKKVPFEGAWTKAPYPERSHDGRIFAVLVDDPEVEALVVDRATGEVLVLDGSVALVNRSLGQFAKSATAYVAARKRAKSIDEDDDEALEANGEEALMAIRAIDADAVADENQFWAVAAEELGYGI